ncbi:MAG: EpsI family protein [Candidatus Rokubacteria bacterium]|nr:EpsI family protein [Candidatus Rokubacteria bacterium]
MTRLSWFSAAALALLGLAGGLFAVPREIRQVPLVAPLETIPGVLRDWQAVDQGEPEMLPQDRAAPAQLVRAYRNGTQMVWVTVGYYPSQVRQRPASQELLYPGQGWSELTARSVTVPLDGISGRVIPANLVVMRGRGREFAVLYWYQVGARTVASDHWNRALLLYNRLVNRRDDGALVRIASPVPEGTGPESVFAEQVEFVQAFYPELLRRLPH